MYLKKKCESQVLIFWSCEYMLDICVLEKLKKKLSTACEIYSVISDSF